MEINWKVRIANKQFWFSLVPAILLVIQAGAAIFGCTIDFGELGNQLLAFVDAVFVILVLLGIVNDPTTSGYSDSNRARHYQTPWED
ncbi:phage holin [Acutalibacter sp. 1XD8-33]|uniref:phage holin n=1 Tax=Acutalibacter sp. 1XD8-33 TaxID=2320081 RepID=UPI000EA3FDC0|nr:phage holin [Acutalibacter sp. 1XD8-33]RKJ38131.1 phage holin [Acutalibacter sp. 1XD8-33]